jgi:protein arginine N-methyltransferase 1
VYGFAIWWECELLPGITLSTSPSSPSTHWEQIYVPVLEPLRLTEGDGLELKLSVDSRREIRINVAWDVRVAAPSGTFRIHQKLDMRQGHVE